MPPAGGEGTEVRPSFANDWPQLELPAQLHKLSGWWLPASAPRTPCPVSDENQPRGESTAPSPRRCCRVLRG